MSLETNYFCDRCESVVDEKKRIHFEGSCEIQYNEKIAIILDDKDFCDLACLVRFLESEGIK